MVQIFKYNLACYHAPPHHVSLLQDVERQVWRRWQQSTVRLDSSHRASNDRPVRSTPKRSLQIPFLPFSSWEQLFIYPNIIQLTSNFNSILFWIMENLIILIFYKFSGKKLKQPLFLSKMHIVSLFFQKSHLFAPHF